MGWYFRKSLNFGGLRLNLSKSGVGVSTGIRAVRFGVSPNGRQYVHCGVGGVYYRKTFSSGGRASSTSRQQAHSQQQTSPRAVTGQQQAIDSGDVSAMVDASAADL